MVFVFTVLLKFKFSVISPSGSFSRFVEAESCGEACFGSFCFPPAHCTDLGNIFFFKSRIRWPIIAIIFYLGD